MLKSKIISAGAVVGVTLTMLLTFQNCADGGMEAISSSLPSAADLNGAVPSAGASVDTGSDPTTNGSAASLDPAYLSTTTYAVVNDSSFKLLMTKNAGCNAGVPLSGNCNSAMHRACRGAGALSGFGANEHDGDRAIYTCLTKSAGTLIQQVSWFELNMKHTGCGPSGLGVSADCNAAISRFCISKGFVTGYGPVEQNNTIADIVCLNPNAGSLYQLRYSEAQNYHPGCTGPAKAVSPDCSAAIHRFCMATGKFATGFGAIENNENLMGIFCVKKGQ